MDSQQEESIYCPYCGELIQVLIDTSDLGQEYIEDCQVCCRPIIFKLTEGDNSEPKVSVYAEDDSY